MSPVSHRVHGGSISNLDRTERFFGGLLRIGHGYSKVLFLPFFRYGFGERYLTYRKGLSTIFLMLFLAWINYTVAFFDPVKFLSRFVSTEIRESEQKNELNEKVRQSISPEEKKLEKQKFRFRLRYFTWYVFLGIYFVVITRHRIKFKRRLAADGYDYSRHSYYSGDSHVFIFLITEKVRDAWLAVVKDFKELWVTVEKWFIIKIDFTRKKASQALSTEKENPAENIKSDAEENKYGLRPALPQDRTERIDIKAPFKFHRLDHKILVCVVEPGLVILLGLVQLFFNQAFGTFCLVIGISHMLIQFTDYGLGRQYGLNKIDKLFDLLAEKDELSYTKDALSKAGHAFHEPVPTEAEILDNLAPNLHHKKERFVVT